MKHDFVNQRVDASQEMSALISRYHASGLGLERFARQEGLPYGRLHYWVYQKSRAKSPKRSQPPAPLFQEVKLASSLASSLPSLSSWAAEISLPKGLSIRFSSAANPNWIASVVATLHAPC
jgi:hypothetical protein